MHPRFEQNGRVLTAVSCLALVLAVGWGMTFRIKPLRKRHWSIHDKSIGQDYKASSVSNLSLPLICSALPLVAYTLVEFRKSRGLVTDDASLRKRRVRALLYFCGIALIAMSTTGLVTNILKVTVARLRPNFLSVCKPELAPGSNSTFICTGNAKVVDGSRMSFPSMHTSTTSCAAALASGYILLGFHGDLLSLFSLLPPGVAIYVGASSLYRLPLSTSRATCTVGSTTSYNLRSGWLIYLPIKRKEEGECEAKSE